MFIKPAGAGRMASTGLDNWEDVAALVQEAPCSLPPAGGGGFSITCEVPPPSQVTDSQASKSPKQGFCVGELSEAAVVWIGSFT